jgi:hypothetical protein
MTRYRIVCTEQEPLDEPHEVAHITAVATGIDPNNGDKGWTLQQVLDAIKAGDQFYTVSLSTKKEANVTPFTCKNCGRVTIRSVADAVIDNNLDSLRPCEWKKS